MGGAEPMVIERRGGLASKGTNVKVQPSGFFSDKADATRSNPKPLACAPLVLLQVAGLLPDVAAAGSEGERNPLAALQVLQLL